MKTLLPLHDKKERQREEESKKLPSFPCLSMDLSHWVPVYTPNPATPFIPGVGFLSFPWKFRGSETSVRRRGRVLDVRMFPPLEKSWLLEVSRRPHEVPEPPFSCTWCGRGGVLWCVVRGVAGTPVQQRANTSISSGIRDYNVDERWVRC